MLKHGWYYNKERPNLFFKFVDNEAVKGLNICRIPESFKDDERWVKSPIGSWPKLTELTLEKDAKGQRHIDLFGHYRRYGNEEGAKQDIANYLYRYGPDRYLVFYLPIEESSLRPEDPVTASLQELFN